MPKPQLDIKPGDRYGYWTVLSTGHHLPGKNRVYCFCKCDCGNTGYVCNSELVHNSRSCGCGLTRPEGKWKGLSRTRLHGIWYDMQTRCYSPKSNNYRNYGAKGITVCDEWKDDFFAFRDWALAHGYNDTLTIHRIDNDKGYSPENCKWATYEEQLNHTSRNHLLTFNGKTQTIAEWSKELGLHHSLIYHRLSYGWSVERALTEPVNTYCLHKSAT